MIEYMTAYIVSLDFIQCTWVYLHMHTIIRLTFTDLLLSERQQNAFGTCLYSKYY